MTAGQPKPEAVSPRTQPLVLEIASQEKQSPLLVPVLIQSLSLRGMTLTVTNPWVITDWKPFHGRHCVLRWQDPGGQQTVNVKAKIAWSKGNGSNQSPLSLGIHMDKPPGQTLKRLTDHVTHTSQDIKELWQRFDQVGEVSTESHMVRWFYLAGLALLLGGVALQFAEVPSYKLVGWVLWFIGSLGILAKLIRSLRPKQAS